MQRINSRLKRLERCIRTENSEILNLIRQGKYYDELTPDQREKYAQYLHNLHAHRYEEIVLLFTPEAQKQTALHFRIERKPKPPTPEEHARRIKEVEEMFSKLLCEDK